MYIGNGGITQAATVTAAGLANTGGTLNITGSAATQAALDIGAAAPATWVGAANLTGDALLQFTGTSQIGTIASGAQIALDGPTAMSRRPGSTAPATARWAG